MFVLFLFISKISHYFSFPFSIVTSICAIGNNIKACHTLCCHILALEPDIDLFIEVLEPLVEVLALEQSCPNVDLDDFDSPPTKQSRRNLDCE
jgi:hypothetical protein